MKNIKIISLFIIVLIMLSSFTCNKIKDINQAVQGVYTIKNYKTDRTIGYLALYSDNYYFAFDENVASKEKENIFNLHFSHNLKDNYKVELEKEIDINKSISKYKNNTIIASINFDPKRLTRLRTIREFLLRVNKNKKTIYFHSKNSEIQLWNISKSWLNNGFSDKLALKNAYKLEMREISEIKDKNKSKKINLIHERGKLYWEIIYTYLPISNGKKVKKKQFTIRVNQKTGKTLFYK